MDKIRSDRRWFLAISMIAALLLLLPTASYILAFRYQVYVSGNSLEWQLSDGSPVAIRQARVGFPFSTVRPIIDAIDTEKNKLVWRWIPQEQYTNVLAISDDSTKMLLSDGSSIAVHEFQPPHRKLFDLPILESGQAVGRARWLDNDRRIAYESFRSGMSGRSMWRIRDLESDSDQSIEDLIGGSGTYMYWLSDHFISVFAKPGTIQPQKVYERDGLKFKQRPDLSSTNVNGQAQNYVFNNETKFYTEGSGVMIDLQSGRKVPVQAPEGSYYSSRTFGKGLVFMEYNDERRQVGAVIIDAETGGIAKTVAFDHALPKESSAIYRGDHFSIFNGGEHGDYSMMSLQGSESIVLPGPKRWWTFAAPVSAAALLIWWLLWVVLMRQKARSNQPAVDLTLLHAIVFIPCTVRLFSGSYNLPTNQLEAIGFFAVTTSASAWFTFWFVFGTNNWQRRCTQSILIIAFFLAVYISLWSNRGGWSMGMISPAFVITAFIVCVATFIFTRLRILHQNEDSVTPSWDARSIRLRQFFVWTIACAILFGVGRYADGIQGSQGDWTAHLVQGAALSLAAVSCIYALLASRSFLAGLIIAALGNTAIAGGLYYAFVQSGWMTISLFHPGGSFVYFFAAQALLIACAVISIRGNGYRLGWMQPVVA